MKKKLLILAGIFIFFQFGYSLKCFFPHYKLEGKKLVYIGLDEKTAVNTADIETFKELDEAFGIDKDHVYYEGKILRNIDSKTFEVTGNHIPVADDPIWGIECQTSYITEFKDKNGIYRTEDIKNGKIKTRD
jgi:hypothetical protein